MVINQLQLGFREQKKKTFPHLSSPVLSHFARKREGCLCLFSGKISRSEVSPSWKIYSTWGLLLRWLRVRTSALPCFPQNWSVYYLNSAVLWIDCALLFAIDNVDLLFGRSERLGMTGV